MKSNQILLLAILAVSLIVMGLMNYAASNAGVKPPPQQTKRPTTPAAVQPAAAKTASTPTDDGKHPLITEATIGDPQTAKLRIVLGYSANDDVEAHTFETNQTIKGVEDWVRRRGKSSLQVICVDIPVSMRSDLSTANVPVGLTINGRVAPGCGGNIGLYGTPLSQMTACLDDVAGDSIAKLKSNSTP